MPLSICARSRDGGNLSNEYSEKKASYHFGSLATLAAGQQPNPVHVLCVLSDLCSHDCTFCLFRASGYETSKEFGIINKSGVAIKNPNRMIPFNKAIEIVDDCHRMGVKAFEFTGGGEPTLHPQFDDILHRTLDTGMQIGMITHGANLPPARIESLAHTEWIRISLDAGTKETYAKTHRVDGRTFDRVIANIAFLADARNLAKTSMHIGVSFVTTKFNFHEMSTAAKLAKDSGADSFRISAEFSPEGIDVFDGLESIISAAAAEVEAMQTESFRVFNHWSTKTSVHDSGRPDYRQCWYQHLTAFIGGNQKVYRCCRTSYQERGLIGSLENQSFEQLWNSESKKRLFDYFDARGCTNCHVNQRNREVGNLMNPPPHVNFV